MNTNITTGNVSIDITDIDSLTATYTAATAGEKTKIRNAITSGMMDAVRGGDMTTATAYANAGDAVKSITTRPVVETDFSRIIADRIIALHHAAHILAMGDVLPDGIDAEKVDMDRVNAMVAEWRDGGDNDSVSDEIAAAAKKVATAKITRSTDRLDMVDVIGKAFRGLPLGSELTVSQIRVRGGAVSDGAVAARLYPAGGPDKITLDMYALGIELAEVIVKGRSVRGARKIALVDGDDDDDDNGDDA